MSVTTEYPSAVAKARFVRATDAIKAAPDNTFKMGGTGSKQEDQIITVALEKVTGKKMTYIPYKGGGAVAVQLVGGHVEVVAAGVVRLRSAGWERRLPSPCREGRGDVPRERGRGFIRRYST